MHVDVSKGIKIGTLTFIRKPELRLLSNKRQAMAVYRGQIRKLSKIPCDRNDVIKSESKLQSLRYIDFIGNLSKEQRAKIDNAKVHYFIPWRAVWNTNSLSILCRLVFEATDSGYSLNNILAKCRNGMNKLVELSLLSTQTYKNVQHSKIG